MKGTNYFLFVATLSLVLQLVVLALIIIAYELRRRFKFRLHGFCMFFAFAIHLAVIGAIMIPSYVEALIPITLSKPQSEISLLSLAHVPVGTAAIVLAAWIMATWRFRGQTEYCRSKKPTMRVTFVLWLIALGIGVVFYFVLNWSLLFS